MNNYIPGRYYQLGWNDRYIGKDKPPIKPRDWSDAMHSEYLNGYADCNNKIIGEAKEAIVKNTMNEGRHFIQE